MWSRHNRSSKSSPSTNRISLNLETLALRDVPSSILDTTANDPSLTSLRTFDPAGQTVLVGTLTASTLDSTGTSTDTTSSDGDIALSADSSSSSSNTTTGSSGAQATETSKSGTTNSAALPAATSDTPSPVTGNNAISGSSSTGNASTSAAPTSGTASAATTNGSQTGGAMMSPDDGQGGLGNGNQGNPNNPAAPQIVNFVAVETSLGMWEFSGTVIDANPGGLTVSFGGQPVSLQGKSATTDADGNFGYATLLNTDGTDDGIATAQTTDGQGLVSNVAMCAVQAS